MDGSGKHHQDGPNSGRSRYAKKQLFQFTMEAIRTNLRVDSVGTVSASLVTYAAIQALQPDLIINAGTAGGFKAKGAGIGDVYVASEVAFHDRRIPIPVFDLYGVGLRCGCSTPNLVKELDFKMNRYLWVLIDEQIFHLRNFVTNLLVLPTILSYQEIFTLALDGHHNRTTTYKSSLG